MDIISLEEVDLYLKCLSSQLNLFNLEYCFWIFFFFIFENPIRYKIVKIVSG